MSDSDLRQLERSASTGVPGAQERLDRARVRAGGTPPNPSGRTVCDRCRWPTFSTIMSMLNTENICPGCKDTERLHPGYRAAEVKDMREYADRIEALGNESSAQNIRKMADELEQR